MAENYLSFSQMITGSDSEIVKWIFFIFLILFICLNGWLFEAAGKKIKKITDPMTNYSYSVLSVTILKIVMVNIIVQIIGYIVEIAMIINNTQVIEIKTDDDMAKAPNLQQIKILFINLLTDGLNDMFIFV